jgi:GT2 family glycosyltransferase
MKLQQLILRDVARENILLPLYITEENIRRKRMSTEELYVRMEESSFLSYGVDGIYFRENGVASFDTFQNGFSAGKWKKYTIIEDVFLSLELRGHFEISLMHAEMKDGEAAERELSHSEIIAEERETVNLDFGTLAEDGIFYAKVKAVQDGSEIFSGYYGTKDLEPTQTVKIAIDICTFKREQYVARNIEILKRDILENEMSPCYGKVWVHISDNASSLDGIVDTQENITVDKNANLGGVGGFTRGIIETQKLAEERGFTHVLLMDDDATISSAAVEANYLLLSYMKPEYFGHTVGGKLLVLNAPFVQFEVGAQWNAGAINALKSERDIRKIEEVIDSEIEDEPVEYQGWWYCCIPLKEIAKDNLPLPIFIHRDDVEYGLRTGKGRFIFMNRICIWHESFAGKMPGVLDYYDIRNLCITNAIQCPEYTKEEFKKYLTKWVWRNIAKYRYKYIDYNIKAVEDFCKGVDWLLQADGGALHKELFAMNYKAKPISEWVGFHGVTEEQLKCREWGFRNPNAFMRLYHKAVANGNFFPAKNHKIVVTDPYGNVHRLYRRDRTIVVDNYGNGVYLERDRKQFWECRRKLKAALKLIDEKYDAAAKSYRDRYGELVSREFWEKYLGI